ncbi:MAG: polymer-forming cytoskeletal protein [Candidatus Coatesbacteria bacterium]|nr:polymer-forming cytoskeletal protein [Candidatus Coatesbacteria bacterium]
MSATKTELNAFLAKGTNFKGELRFSGIVRIDGIFEGKIYSDGTLVIGDTGIVRGDIQVGELLSSGVVDGKLRASRLIDVTGNGKLLGEIHTPSLNVAQGVTVEAQFRVIGREDAPGGSKGSSTKMKIPS